jgi:hypothetical protein
MGHASTRFDAARPRRSPHPQRLMPRRCVRRRRKTPQRQDARECSGRKGHAQEGQSTRTRRSQRRSRGSNEQGGRMTNRGWRVPLKRPQRCRTRRLAPTRRSGTGLAPAAAALITKAAA